MTGILDERERGYEAKWAHDEEMRFEIMALRNRLLGAWAAGLMKLPAEESGHYAEAVVQAGLAAGADPVFRKLRSDLDARKVACANTLLHQKMQELFHQAEAQILQGRIGRGPRGGEHE